MTNPQSNATFPSELDSSDALWDQMLKELEQEWGTRELVALALREANTAFVAQFTEPDGYSYMDACARFGDFLALNNPMSYADQKTVSVYHASSASPTNHAGCRSSKFFKYAIYDIAGCSVSNAPLDRLRARCMKMLSTAQYYHPLHVRPTSLRAPPSSFSCKKHSMVP
jgi:hypothetical protein